MAHELSAGAPQRPTPIEFRRFRRNSNVFTAILGIFYWILTLLVLTGKISVFPRDAGLISLFLGPLSVFFVTALIWLTFSVQLAILDLLAFRLRFRWNALIALFAGPILAMLILRVLLFFHYYLS